MCDEDQRILENSWPRCTSSAKGEEVRSPDDEYQRFRFYGRLSNFLTYKRNHAYQVSHQMFLTVLIPGITLQKVAQLHDEPAYYPDSSQFRFIA